MSKQKKNNENNNNDDDKTIDRIIQIILIIIIILLLLHNCSLMKKKGNKDGKVNIIDITCNSNKCEQQDVNVVDCLKDPTNSQCLVPDFKGKTKKELLKWLNSISNTIEIEIKLVEDPNYPDGTIISQSIVGTSVKDLLEGRTKLVITVVNNGSLVDCQKNSNNSKCTLPNFVGKKTNDVENWVNGIANHINIKYVYIESNTNAGTVVKQSIKSGTPVKDILDKNQTLIIYISKGKTNPNSGGQGGSTNPDKPTPTPTPEPEPEPEPEFEGEFWVSDKEKVKWQNEIDLNIFEDSSKISKVRGKIAPESSGIYKFTLHNKTNYNLKYKITFTETNQDNMNMKYKLKQGNTYIIDHYVAYDQLDISDKIINSDDKQDYYLEWKWDGNNDSNDTRIGKKAKNTTVKYDLKINVEAESV